MMASLGPHAGFIVGAYLAALIVTLAVIVWVWLDYRRQRRILADLDARGITRRSLRQGVSESLS
ncbi:MAG: heme exporter protein CcmD [Rhizobiales bacterium]|nr:heme exporter protein CcmD [Hyphomicrobiales bacterium]OJY41330.1 MAG: heme exporter protein CcmD [Rhizobiales bacterium 64-17]